MARELAIILFWVLVILAVAQYPLLRIFLRMLRGRQSASPHQGSDPKVAVILCLRGEDPFLADCLRAVLNQDYPRYDVQIVVDSRNDPAWSTVERLVRETGDRNVHVEPLRDRRETCSLKCSSLVQAVSDLDESYEVVALVDSDTVPHRTWLRELVNALEDDEVGAATGNRWFMPGAFSWASLVRYLWNAEAVVQMGCFGIPWGGTLAIKREVFRKSDLLGKWSRAFCEDTMLYEVLDRLALRLAFVPSLMMVNREDCTMAGLVQWLRRQLLAARLYHPRWAFVRAHGLGTGLVWFAALAVGVWGLVVGDRSAAAWSAVGALVYIVILVGYLPFLESAVRRIVRGRGESTSWMRLRTVLSIVSAGVLLQLIYPVVLLSTLGLRRVRWRDVEYRVWGPFRVRLTEDGPYRSEKLRERSLSL
jgi:cellulose synthase/poly-beta-1,6-N-acetylglucosamine synthase-like glycosyltransferase